MKKVCTILDKTLYLHGSNGLAYCLNEQFRLKRIELNVMLFFFNEMTVLIK